ncbi:MAG TPA: hypothetical protein PK357_00850 [Candidatus Pacearchaeota archaeon]|nr:hypothetical protein [Candidatus Pacearchaeota archaeon]
MIINMRKKYNNRKEKAEALFQILILVIGIIAISWMIGSEIDVVSAEDKTNTPPKSIEREKLIPKDTISNIASGITITEKSVETYNKLAKVSTSETASKGEILSKLKELGLNSPWLLGGETIVGSAIAISAWAAIAFLVGRYVLGPLFGLNVQQSQSLGYALAGGTAAGLLATSEAIFGTSAVGGPVGILIGAAVAFVIFVALAKKSSTDLIQLTCYEWDSQSGAGLTETQMKERCEACNKQENFGCTEYQCRSLGQGCMLIGEIGSGNELCIWNNTKDITPPIIKAWKNALKDNFTYTPDNALSPPDTGVKVIYTGKEQVTTVDGMRCAPPYTPVSFGVELDEPAICKINTENLANYSIMADMFMTPAIRTYNHSFALSLPSKEAMEAANITVDNGGRYELFIRCKDSNGNSNIGNFVFKFCISEGPDLTPPNILGANILNNSPIGFGQTSVNLSLYTNEPADCKWSHLDKDYNSMEEIMNCDKSLSEYNANMIYTCRTNLTGLKNSQDNKFYFKCKDNSSNNNTNTQSYLLNIIGTRPLVIEEVSPKNGETIEDSTESAKVELKVRTSAGYQEGKAICAFSETGNPGTYVDFFYENYAEPYSQYEHTQELWLAAGEYTYYIKCRDLGGNTDDANATFNVKIDKESPMVVRVYKEDEYLKVTTDEPGTCVYSTYGCTYLFEDGTALNKIDEKEFYSEWNTNVDFYIKCQDEYGNQPSPSECSIIARPFEIASLE